MAQKMKENKCDVIEVESESSESEPDSEQLPFDDVSSDVEFVAGATALETALKQLSEHLDAPPGLQTLLGDEELDPTAAADRDLFLLYAINSLFWAKLKLEGQDPTTHPVKQHLQKVRELMQRKQAILDKRNRPVLNKKVAERFIRSGLWQPKNKKDQDTQSPNKKIKFTSD
ncbi:ribosomal RNA processing 47 [Arctopsyche grandis]|uniref:ribosomal RNA processing 47 n=1 Tax=Arctopsyche grandis TaxID=121162 RepID=UPI00406D7BED